MKGIFPHKIVYRIDLLTVPSQSRPRTPCEAVRHVWFMAPMAAGSISCLGTPVGHLHDREQVGVTTDLGLDPTLV